MQKESRLILGIDPGTQATGYGIIQVQGRLLSAITFGTITPSKQLPLEKRYLAIFSELEEILSPYPIHEAAVETQFLKNNVQVILKLGMARGICVLACSRKGIPIFEYSPRKAKQALVGNGAATKEQVQKMVKMLLGLKELPAEDAADALALAICHSHQLPLTASNNRLKETPYV